MSSNDLNNTAPPAAPPQDEDLPEQKHVGKVGYGPNYHSGPTLQDKIGGLKEELMGKVERKPERVQHGHEIRSGEERRKKLTGDDAPNPFKAEEDAKKAKQHPDTDHDSKPDLSNQTSNTSAASRPSGPTSSSSPHPSQSQHSQSNFGGNPAGGGGGGGGFISDSHARDLYDHHDAQHEERLAQSVSNNSTSGANPQGMAAGQGYGNGAKEQAATVAPQGTKEAEYQRKGEAVDRVKNI